MKIEARQLYRHKKSGRIYEVLGTGKMCLPHDEWVESVSYKLHSEWRGYDIYTRPMAMFSQRMELLKERMIGAEMLEELKRLIGPIDIEQFEREHELEPPGPPHWDEQMHRVSVSLERLWEEE